MSYLTKIAVVLGLLVVSACSSATGPVAPTVSGWQLQDVSVRFGPDISRTADGQSYSSNFLWNGFGFGDGAGNRKKQVAALFRVAMEEVGAEAMTGSQAVNMNVQVNYFHASTYTSRLFCCGSNKIYADVEVVDAATGASLAKGENLALGRVALGGLPAVVAQMAGNDQWVRIKNGIIRGTRDWLGQY